MDTIPTTEIRIKINHLVRTFKLYYISVDFLESLGMKLGSESAIEEISKHTQWKTSVVGGFFPSLIVVFLMQMSSKIY